MPHDNELARNTTSLHLHTITSAQKRARWIHIKQQYIVYIYFAPILTADSVCDWQSKYANEGRGTGCLCVPIAQNCERTKLAYDDFNIADGYMGDQLSRAAMK